MVRDEIRRFMADIPAIRNATIEERLSKLDEEVKELIEVMLDPSASIDERLGEIADVGIVASTITEMARELAAELRHDLDSLMICKMDEARKKYLICVDNGP